MPIKWGHNGDSRRRAEQGFDEFAKDELGKAQHKGNGKSGFNPSGGGGCLLPTWLVNTLIELLK